MCVWQFNRTTRRQMQLSTIAEAMRQLRSTELQKLKSSTRRKGGGVRSALVPEGKPTLGTLGFSSAPNLAPVAPSALPQPIQTLEA